jgi:hypothetical protein
MRILCVLIVGSALFGGAFVAVAEAAGLNQPLVPHRAVYSMHLSKSGGSGGLTGARGVMTYEYKDQCDAWTVETKIYLRLRYGNGPEIENIRSMVTWEAKNGLSFRFRVNELTNGKKTEEIKGVAALDGAGLGGVAEYTKPNTQKVVLPPGTLFPTAHLKSLIKVSIDGRKHLTKPIFDGATLDNPYQVSAAIGPGKSKAKLTPKLSKVLGKIQYWNVRLAYFPLRDSKQTPDIELGVEVRADGIVKRLIQDFGKYVVEARLEQIQLLEKSGC